MDSCVCGHPQAEHLVGQQRCLAFECGCDQYRHVMPLAVKTLLDTNGVSRVELSFEDSTLQLTPDAAVQIGLNLISAGYAARGEKALYEYAVHHNLDLQELIKLERL